MHTTIDEYRQWGRPGFYIAHEPAIRGKRAIDLAKDPPPDLALEIDITTRRNHRPIHAAPRVPELWRFDGTHLHIHRPRGDSYIPGLPLADAIPRFLEQSRVDGRNATPRAFRDWI